MFLNNNISKKLPEQVTLLLGRINIKVVVIIICSSLNFLDNLLLSQQEKLNWVELSHHPLNQPIKFISAKTKNDFWAEDKNGFLFHFFNGIWKEYSLPIKSSLNSYHFFSLSDDSFLIGIIDKNYFTHFFRFEKGIFYKYDFITQKPIEGFISAPSGEIFAFGDWGLLASFYNGQWKLLHPPIKNPIISSAFYDGKIFFGTRGEGIFSYDFKNFNIHKTEKWDKSDIKAIKKHNENLYAINNNKETYIFQSDSFRLTDQIRSEDFDKIKITKFGFCEINRTLFTKNKTDYHFSIEFDFSDLIEVSEDEILLSLNDGNILISKKQKENFFTRKDYIYQTEGAEKINSIGASFIHLDSDLLPDLFVLNLDKEFGSKLYKNNYNSRFSDLSINLNHINNANFSVTKFTDLNNDYLPDFIGVSTVKGQSIISVALGVSEFKFSNAIDYFSATTSDIRNIRQFDINNDGRNDLFFNAYLDFKRDKGLVQLYLNENINGKLKEDTLLNRISSSWNLQTINADFDNDDIDDIFIITRWSKNILLINKDGKFSNEYDLRFPKENLFNSNYGIAFDYDNDADLDIFVSTDEQIIVLYENNGKGLFKNVTEQKFTINKSIDSLKMFNIFINSGDFNNDGFTDLLLNLQQKGGGRNYLLINYSGKAFIDYSNLMNIDFPEVNGTAIADIDNDGDLDIYGYRYGKNVFWINNLDDNNYLKIYLKGVISNSEAVGTKIWIYKSGYLNQDEYLFSFKQTGSESMGANSQNDLILHFGLPNNIQYDIRVLFPSGREKILKQVNVPQTLTIEELEGIAATLYLLPSNIMRLINQSEIQRYILVVLLTMLILYLGLKYGVSTFKWELKLTVMLTTVNLSIFWLLIMLTYDDHSFYKYLIPPIVLSIGIFLPNLIYYYIKKREFGAESIEEKKINYSNFFLIFLMAN